VNKERITELFCVNKDKPITMCYGKCYLKKQLSQTKEEKEENSFQLHEIPVFVANQIGYDLVNKPKAYKTDFNSLYKENYQYLISQDIFHPPQTFA
jgi:hypothetical protein